MRVVAKLHVVTLAAFFYYMQSVTGTHHVHTIGLCDIASSLHL